MAMLIFGQTNNKEDQEKMAKKMKDFVEKHTPDGSYVVGNTSDGSQLRGVKENPIYADENYERIDYTKPRDFVHIEEDIKIFSEWYENEKPNCTLAEYLAEELGNVEYYTTKEVDFSEVLEAIERSKPCVR